MAANEFSQHNRRNVIVDFDGTTLIRIRIEWKRGYSQSAALVLDYFHLKTLHLAQIYLPCLPTTSVYLLHIAFDFLLFFKAFSQKLKGWRAKRPSFYSWFPWPIQGEIQALHCQMWGWLLEMHLSDRCPFQTLPTWLICYSRALRDAEVTID